MIINKFSLIKIKIKLGQRIKSLKLNKPWINIKKYKCIGQQSKNRP